MTRSLPSHRWPHSKKRSTQRSSPRDQGVPAGAPRRIFGTDAAHLRCCGLRSSLTHRRMRSLRCSAAPSIWATSAPNLSTRSPAVTPVGWVGVWLLVASFVAMLAEGLLVAVWGLAVARRTRALSELVESEQGLIEADIKKLRSALEETQRLWKPYRRALRWLRHPLAIALLRSYAMRRAAR